MAKDDQQRRTRVPSYRHTIAVRITHWINVLCILLLVPTGIQILNAHPALYWGNQSNFAHPFITFPEGLPNWPKIPSWRDLATGRNWHFFAAWIFMINGAAYLANGFLRGHFVRDLAPTLGELRHIGETAKEHAKLRFPQAPEYNVIQKLSYIAVIVLLTLMLLSGLAMSPGMDAAFPGLVSVFGGRQSARTIHFLSAAGIVLFIFVHVVLVMLSGFVNNMRSMITGRYDIEAEAAEAAELEP